MLTATLVVLLMLLLNALFVAAEFASVSARRSRIRKAAEKGSRRARMILTVLEDPVRHDRYISACQLGITVTSLGLGAYCQHALADKLVPLFASDDGTGLLAARSLSVAIVLIFVTFLQVLVGEQMPKSMALDRPNLVVMVTVLPVQLCQWVLSYAISFLNGSARAVLWLIRAPRTMGRHVHSRQEIDLLMRQSRAGGRLASDQHERLQHTLELEVITARQLMVPRQEIAAIDLEEQGEDTLRQILDGRYTRLPVYKKSIDDIVGIIHSKDLARQAVAEGNLQEWKNLIRPVFFVNEGMTADRLLSRLRERRTQQAIVMDEFGGVAGLVTLEDLLKHVFGDVGDEFSEQDHRPEPLADGRLRLPGRCRLDEVEDWLGIQFSGSANTVGGCVIEALGHLPEIGEKLVLDGLEVEVEKVENHVVSSLLVHPRTGRSTPKERGSEERGKAPRDKKAGDKKAGGKKAGGRREGTDG